MKWIGKCEINEIDLVQDDMKDDDVVCVKINNNNHFVEFEDNFWLTEKSFYC